MRLLPFLFLLFVAAPVWAQAPLPVKSDKPVEIEADQQLEWLRNDNKFRATGNVVITQGDTIINGDTAEAEYDKTQGPSALTTMIVTGNVVIHTGENVIHAEEAQYDTRTEILNLRGKTVTLKSPSGDVTSVNGMDYFAKERKAVSKGAATVTQKTETLKAQSLTAWMNEKNELSRAEAVGNVVITQKTEDGTNIAQAQRGTYDAAKQIAVLTGDVKLTQGQNYMQGDKATINLATGYSSLQNNQGTGGRVRAIFTPDSDNGNAVSVMPSLNQGMPAITPKKKFEQPYAVGNSLNRDTHEQRDLYHR